MCGIAGIFAYKESAPNVDLAELIAVRDAMIVRGPDGAGHWLSSDRRVGLGHRRLAFIDLSEAGLQPMAMIDGSLQVTFNGEIYNYQSIRSRLEARGVKFKSNSDTEVLLHLYAEKGPAMLDELRGMYAFGIWDATRGQLFLARDPFGIKPLYYADDGTTVRFASQVRALLKAKCIDTASDAAGAVGFMLWGYVPEPYTLYSGIRSLPSGSWLAIDRDGTRKSGTFCRISDEIAATEHRAKEAADGDFHERLRAAMLDTVKHHMIADVPVGVFLSSGRDSTTLTALAAELSGSCLHSVTLGFEEYRGSPADEVPIAELVAKQFGTTHDTRWVSRGEFHRDFAAMMSAMDQPSIDGANTYFVSKAAKQAGLKAALSGLGGDELFGGYSSFQQIPQLVRTVGKFPLGAAKALRAISAPLLKHFTSAKYAGLLEYGGSYSGAYLLRRGLFMPWELPNLLDPDLVRQGWRALQPILALEATVKGIASDRLRVSALEMTWYMRNQLLRDSDWAGMAHSLEIRVPLVDLTLLRSVMPLTLHGQGKAEMARTPTQTLPGAILNRQKTGFSIPIGDWISESDPQNCGRGLRGGQCDWRGNSISSPTIATKWGKPKVRILHVIPSLAQRHGGPPKAAQELCRELARMGHEVTIYTTNLDGNQRLDIPVDQPIRGEDGVVRWYFATQRSGLYGISLSLIRALRRNIHSFDVVHIHTLYRFTSTVAAHYCRREGVPYILRTHGTLDPFLFYRHRFRKRVYEALFETRNLERAAAVHFTANEEMHLAQSLGLRFRGVVVPNGVDLRPPSDGNQLRRRFCRDWPATADKRVILFLGRLTFKKGIDLLVKAFGTVARTRSDVHLFLAGPDDEGYGTKVRHWLDAEGVLDHVTFAGMLEGERKEAAFAGSDMFVLPSYTENFGIAVAEALAAGTPVIVSNKVNIYREINEARAGLVVNCDSDELAGAISRLLDSAELRHELASAGKQLVAEKFNWPNIAIEMNAVYTDAVARRMSLGSPEASFT